MTRHGVLTYLRFPPIGGRAHDCISCRISFRPNHQRWRIVRDLDSFGMLFDTLGLCSRILLQQKTRSPGIAWAESLAATCRVVCTTPKRTGRRCRRQSNHQLDGRRTVDSGSADGAMVRPAVGVRKLKASAGASWVATRARRLTTLGFSWLSTQPRCLTRAWLADCAPSSLSPL